MLFHFSLQIFPLCTNVNLIADIYPGVCCSIILPSKGRWETCFLFMHMHTQADICSRFDIQNDLKQSESTKVVTLGPKDSWGQRNTGIHRWLWLLGVQNANVIMYKCDLLQDQIPILVQQTKTFCHINAEVYPKSSALEKRLTTMLRQHLTSQPVYVPRRPHQLKVPSVLLCDHGLSGATRKLNLLFNLHRSNISRKKTFLFICYKMWQDSF